MSFKSTRQSRRLKNNRVEDQQQQQPFFAKASDTVQTKADTAFFQPKLTIGQPNDKYEKEADSVADSVVNRTGQQSAIQQKEISGIQRTTLATPMEDEKLSTTEARMERDKLIQEKPEVQRMDAEEEEGMVSKMEEEEGEVQTKTSSGNPNTASPKMTNKIKNKSGKGRGLAPKVKSEMEAGFGVDFSGVNIHTDKDANEMNQNLQAQAFTQGQDIYFNSGKYNPETSNGKRLLAHELTHVVQQTNNIQPYREKGATNFGVGNSGSLKERRFNIKTDKYVKPWVSKILVSLNKKTTKDKKGVDTHKGTLVAKYFNNKHKFSDIAFPVTGGSTMHRSSEANHKVHRIEGPGYMSSAYSDSYIPNPDNKRYNIDSDSANMHYAIFYKGAQAIHGGLLDEASHGCLHVDNAKLKQLNFHSVNGLSTSHQLIRYFMSAFFRYIPFKNKSVAELCTYF